MTEKKTLMVLKVDLQCPCCHKKIQKILCEIPQITDRIFDEKANMVMITVKCCSPEKIRDKICCKAGKILQNIEIKEPNKPKEEKPKDTEKPKETEKPPKETEKPKSNGKGNTPPPGSSVVIPTVHPANTCCGPCSEGRGGGPCHYVGPPVVVPTVQPANPCCGPCSESRGGGPCHYGYRFPPPPPQPCYDGNYGPGYVYVRPCYVTRCDYISEENSTGCTIM